MSVNFQVNGKPAQVNAETDTLLLWVLRDELGMTGTKFGCGAALCGACTVHVNGQAVRSCQTPLSSVAGQKVATVEGLSKNNTHPLQVAWINPDTVEAQLQSSIVFGVGAVLKHQITMANGRVQETNYNSYEPVRMYESPQIDIVLVKSTEKPGRIGEPGTAVAAPAIANAVAALTGKRVRRLPITASALRSA